MRLAVISDIHGNLVALEAVLADLEAAGGAEVTWCLGDLAAFGPRPKECVQRIKALAEADEGKKFRVIGGNTDRYMIDGTRFKSPSAKDEEQFKQLAKGWQARDTVINWGVEQLGWEEYEYLKKIRYQELATEVEDYGWVIGYHAIPGDDETFLNPETPDEQALDYLLDREGRLGIGGHTHIQMDRDLGRWRLVNVGSVGASTDMPGKAQYGIFTFENGAVNIDLRALDYDLERALADVTAVGHPVPEFIVPKIEK